MKLLKLVLFLPFILSFQQEASFTHHVWAEKETLNITFSGEADVVTFKMFEGLSLELKKNPKGIFEGAVEIPNIEEAIFQYKFDIEKQTGTLVKTLEYTSEDNNGYFKWIGNNSKIFEPKTENLKGALIDKDLNSQYLEKPRTVSIYIPQNTSATNIPIVYMTDGQALYIYAEYIERLIEEKAIQPLILVGVYAGMDLVEIEGGYKAHSRVIEYLDMGMYDEQFNRHQRFFLEEVIEEVEQNILPSGKTYPRYLYGVSNGGAYCVQVALNHPTIFEKIIAFSTVGYISGFPKPITFDYDDYPEMYLAAGRYETEIFKNNKAFYQQLLEKEVNVEFQELICGHDAYAWKQLFCEYLIREFEK